MLGQGCTLPPGGWSCARERGHAGPCAAYPAITIIPDATVPRDEVHFTNSSGETVGKIVGLKIERPSKEEMFLRIAEVVATRSTCSRLSVGAVVTDWEMTTAKSLGYNGNARGLPNGCDTTTPGACGCLHAEDNALLKAPYENTGPLVLFCTHNPCVTCAKRILNTRVQKVVYRNEYRSKEGIVLLRENGVTPVHLPAT